MRVWSRALLVALAFLCVPRALPAQEPQQLFASAVLEARARGDSAALQERIQAESFRAVLLVHDLLYEAAAVSLEDARALQAARDLAAVHAEVMGDDYLVQAVQSFTARRPKLPSGQDSFPTHFGEAVRAFEAQQWTQFETALDAAMRAVAEVPYFEWRARRLAAAYGYSRQLDERLGAELPRLVELERQLRLHEAAVEDLRGLGALHLAGSRWESATAAYREALELSASIGDSTHRGVLWEGLGTALANLGEYEEARVALRAAMEFHRSLGRTRAAAYAHQQASFLEASAGRYARALVRGREALELYRESGDSVGAALARTHLAAVQSELGLIADAERETQLALEILDTEGEPRERARARTVLGLARLDAGRALDALPVFEEAQQLFLEAGDDAGRAETHYLRGRALSMLGRDREAETALREGLALPRSAGDALQRSLAWTGLGEAVEHLQRMDEAESAFRRALEEGEFALGLERSWRAYYGLGRVAEARGEASAALAHYTTAIDTVEEIRRVLAAPSLRLRYLGDKLELYRRATRLLLADGELERAFSMSERLRARTLLEFAALRPARSAYATSPAQDRLRAAESRLLLLEQELGRVQAGPSLEAVGERLDQARSEHATARRAVELADSRGASLSGLRDPPGLFEVQSRLAPKEALLAYVTAEAGTALIMLRSDSRQYRPLAVDGARLERLVDRLLHPARLLRAGKTDLANLGFDARAAHELYNLLIEPVAEDLAGCELLWIVADGPLRALPFAALVEELRLGSIDPEQLHAHHRRHRYLIESFALGYLPSAGFVGPAVETRSSGTEGLVFSAPEPRPAGSLPLTLLEISGRDAELLPGRTLTGVAASEASFKRLAPGADFLHLSTHGWLDDRRPSYSRIALAPGEGEDGWLHAWEVEALALRAQRVVLAACETLGSSGRGEGLLGLTRAFLVAGARSVIATAWRVDDEATAWMMGEYHAALASGASSSHALRQAQIATLRAGGRDRLSYANPFFWAGFLQVGQD